MKRRSKNAQIYEALALLDEGGNYSIPCDTKAEAEKLRRTISIYLKRESPDIFTTSVVPVLPLLNQDAPEKFEVIVTNYPKSKKTKGDDGSPFDDFIMLELNLDEQSSNPES